MYTFESGGYSVPVRQRLGKIAAILLFIVDYKVAHALNMLQLTVPMRCVTAPNTGGADTKPGVVSSSEQEQCYLSILILYFKYQLFA